MPSQSRARRAYRLAMLQTRVRAGVLAGVVLSLVFASMITLTSEIEVLLPLAPQLGQATPVTLRAPSAPRITKHHGEESASFAYERARVLVPRGTVLSESNDDHRAAFADDSLRRPARPTRLLAGFVVHFVLLLMLTAYLRTFGHSRLRLLRTQLGMMSVMLLAVVAAKGLFLFTALPELWVPIASVPLWIALSLDRRTALVTAVVLAFLTASLLRLDVYLLSMTLLRGMAATVLFFSVKRPRQMLVAGTLAGLSAAVLYVCLAVVLEGSFSVRGDLRQGLGSLLLSCVGGGVLSGGIAFALRQPAEWLLGHVSRDRLYELADLEQPLLQKMAREAPGSWEHARAMANLAEAAASAIGADALLTRVGAYYHDLGKTTQASYFIENLQTGEPSPHDGLEPDVSADAIMAHVVLGTKILREGNIPEAVVEFVYTHHGTQLVEFFWHRCREQGNPKQLTEEHFRYPGMKPQTKETAILMLVDSIEAASRTVNPPERAKFEQMIQRVVFGKLQSGQLDESGLSLDELRTIVVRMADTLVNVHHSRIKYPWQKGESSQRLPVAVVREAVGEKAGAR